MPVILNITSSPKGPNSITIKLGNAIIDKIRAIHPENTIVKELDLVNNPFPHLTGFHQGAAAKRSEDAIREIMAADILIIGAPMHNYSIPSALKAYIDHIVRAGITFGPTGLFKNKKVYIAFSAGWNFSDSDLQRYDFAVPYLKAILELMGIPDITVFRVEGALKEVALGRVIEGMVI